ncbi:MAG: hypothetical protein LUH21_26780 [Clostridiales bacterium]|nr:hypothetical protein [Clostridiales bacterium]
MKNLYFTLAYDGSRLVGYSGMSDSFFFADLETHQVNLVQDCLSQNKNEPYGCPCSDHGTVWFPPFRADELIHISDDKISRYPIEYRKETSCRFVNSYTERNRVFLLPGCCKGIVVFDMESHRETVIDDWCWQYERYIPPEKKNAEIYGKSRYGSYVRQGEYLYMPLLHAPVILKMNRHTYKTEIIHFENQDSSGFLAVYEDINKHLFVITRSSNEIIEIYQDKIVNTYFAGLDGDTFGRSLNYEGRLYILGNERGSLLSFDLLTKNVRFHSMEPFFSPEETTKFGSLISVGGHLLVSDIKTGKTISLYPGLNAMEMKEIIWKIDENHLQEIMAEKMKAGQMITENKVYTLERFLNIDLITEKTKTERDIGAEIFRSLR